MIINSMMNFDAGGALMLASLAHRVLCFTPQLDLSSYPAITRADFNVKRRTNYKEQLESILQSAVRDKGVQIEVSFAVNNWSRVYTEQMSPSSTFSRSLLVMLLLFVHLAKHRTVCARYLAQVHYGDECAEDRSQVNHLRQLGLPPCRSSDGGGCLKLVPHAYHEHVLSMELRRRGELTGLVQSWFDGHDG